MLWWKFLQHISYLHQPVLLQLDGHSLLSHRRISSTHWDQLDELLLCIYINILSLQRWFFTHSELVVQLVREQRVRQLPEVSFAQRADAVDVLQIHILVQVWVPVTLKLPLVVGEQEVFTFTDKGSWRGTHTHTHTHKHTQGHTTCLSFWMLDDTPDNL